MSHISHTPPYQKTREAILHEFDTHGEHGLDASAVKGLLLRHGKNVLSREKSGSVIDRIVQELRSPLVFILLCAGIVTTLLHEYIDSTVIFIAVIINIAISLYQEGRADQAFDKLRASQEKFAVVIRDRKKSRISSAELVPGDLIVVEPGVNIPADARIILAHNLEVNESPLTGEWVDVSKNDTVLKTMRPPSEQKNMLFMGTMVTSGSGIAVVVATGNCTEIGVIAKALGASEELKTPLQENVVNVARFLTRIVLFALIAIFTLGLLRGEPLTDLLLISIAIAVAAIPEGLPAAVTVVLAIGMEAILKRGGLVRNLLAAETLGSTTVILTDKTGTLTKAEMQVARVVTLGTIILNKRKKDGVLAHEAHGDERDVLEFATLASDAFIEKTGEGEAAIDVVRGRPVERAIVSAALASGLNQTELLHNYPRIDMLPFESKYRVAMSLHSIRGLKHKRAYITGAPEYILENAYAVYLEGKEHAKKKEILAELEHELKHYTSRGMRLIGVGYKDVEFESFPKEDGMAREELMKDIVFMGFVVLHDPLRDDVAESIATAKHAGARVIMATGDNPETARSIAAECDIWKEGDHVLSGAEVGGLSDNELANKLKTTSVFSRMLPEHKLRLVRLLTSSGEVVAMTGDGVNDAPALRAANIGVALGSGTEVAKEASDLILLNNSFAIIVAAIEEGRRIIDNLRKIIAYLLSTSFSEIIVVGVALIIALPIPLLPAQILWINILTEGFMNFAFAFEPKEEGLMERDPKVAGARTMLSRSLTFFIIIVGIISGLILSVLYWLLISVWNMPIMEARTMIFVALTLGTVLIAFSMKDLRTPIFRIRLWTNKYLIGALAFGIAGLLAALYVPPLRELLRLAEIDLVEKLPLLASVVLLNIAAVEVTKFFLFPRPARS